MVRIYGTDTSGILACPLQKIGMLGLHVIPHGLAVAKDKSVQIDKRADTLMHGVGYAGDDSTAVRVATEHHIPEILPAEHIADVEDVQAEIDLVARKV